MKEDYNISVGSRVLCQNYVGTVKYIGQVEGYDGEWIGMDWDDAERGKHNGVVNGKQYFTTRYPKSGSLVRRNKINVGVEFVDALGRRYLHKTDAEYLNPVLLEECRKVLNTVSFEVVGLNKVGKKQSNLDKLVNICLPGEKISYVNTKKLNGLCPSAEELSLNHNLISNWRTVADIIEAMPCLRLLDLSKNILDFNEKDLSQFEGKFKSLKSFALCFGNLTFDNAISISKMMPGLIELKLAKNNITSLRTLDDNLFANIKELNLDANDICDWKEVEKLGHLKNLEILLISEIKLKEISLPECKENEKCDIFVNLRHLSISYNEIDNWRSISELNKLKSLKSLGFLGNAVSEGISYLERWSQVVSRVLGLTHLDHAEIFYEERRGAEYDLLKQHGMAWAQSCDDPILRKKFVDEINSYPALITRYGAPETSLCEKPTLPKSKLLTVTITNTRDSKKIIKKLPVKMTVQSLLGLIQKCFDTGNNVPTLYYISPSNPGSKIQLDNVTKNLNYFSLQDNDTIVAEW
ncbi:tubulin-specific chaperone E [Ctenocephalides felis]|uniref:tubulin-specific chaperone E n=1 Tax=Ctenocephalides felis TaxID=7515 RepID=UPI000E6E16DC|nr:tubulin-specific chaperone E [Ctenocephalides felis]